MNIIKQYKKSVKFTCKTCGNAQTATFNSRCHRDGECSHCLQKQYSLGKVAYWA